MEQVHSTFDHLDPTVCNKDGEEQECGNSGGKIQVGWKLTYDAQLSWTTFIRSMDRLTFLRGMLGNTALLTLPPLDLLAAPDKDRLAWTTDANLIFVFDDYVRGFAHYNGPTLINKIKDLDPLDLVREYDNEHDVNAVAVYWEGQKLGYLPMGENVCLAYMLDHGLLLEASVIYTQPDHQPWEQLFMAVHLLMPSNPSFDAYIDHYMEREDAGYKRRPEYGGEV